MNLYNPGENERQALFLVLLRSHGFASVTPTQSKQNASVSKTLAIKSSNLL
jgi:hypothetical protein